MFCRRMNAGLLAGGLLLGVLSATALAEEPGQPATTETIAPPSPEQISRWIAELDDNLFDTRENAQQYLEDAGVAALEEVAGAARWGSLEGSTRALNILLSWSESEDYDLRIAALERIVKLPQRPTEAELAGEILADVRQDAALAKIVELGGLHTPDPQTGGITAIRNGRQIGPLQVIIGAHWKGGVDGLKHLKEVRRTTTLSLHSAPLGDEAVPALLELDQLARIEVYGTEISPESIDKLREKFADKLAVRSGARLGIQGLPGVGPAQVRGIIEGSAAQQAGLQPGDIIKELNGTKIEDFTALTDRIATHQPGESVVLKVTRPNPDPAKTQNLDIKVTFDQWGTDDSTPTLVQPMGQTIQGQIVPPATIRIERR